MSHAVLPEYPLKTGDGVRIGSGPDCIVRTQSSGRLQVGALRNNTSVHFLEAGESYLLSLSVVTESQQELR